MDHLLQIPQVGPEWEDLTEGWTTLGFLAGVTRTARLGTMVTNVGLRNPSLLAKMVATLDVLSGGRAFCGIGAGWFAKEEELYGYPPSTAAERLDRLEAALQLLLVVVAEGSGKGPLHLSRFLDREVSWFSCVVRFFGGIGDTECKHGTKTGSCETEEDFFHV